MEFLSERLWTEKKVNDSCELAEIFSSPSVQVEQQKQALVLRERSERAAQDSGALSELQEVLDRERGRADDLQVITGAFTRLKEYFRTRICVTELS